MLDVCSFKMTNKALAVISTSAFVIGALAPLIGITPYCFYAGLMVIIVVAHRSVFRQNKRGLLPRWTKPGMFQKMTLSNYEIALIILGASFSLGTIISLLIAIQVMT